jgi:hypothetical protein
MLQLIKNSLLKKKKHFSLGVCAFKFFVMHFIFILHYRISITFV